MTEWQPIETAPKKSETILLATAIGPVMAMWDGWDWWRAVSDQYGTATYELDDNGRFEQPLVVAPITHWMPLPPPPEK